MPTMSQPLASERQYEEGRLARSGRGQAARISTTIAVQIGGAGGGVPHIRSSGSGAAVPIVYGYAGVSGTLVFRSTRRGFGTAPGGSRDAVAGLPDYSDADLARFGRGQRASTTVDDQLLVQQYVLSAGALTEVQTLMLDGQSLGFDGWYEDAALLANAWRYSQHWWGSEAVAAATAILAGERSAASAFTGLTAVTGTYYQRESSGRISEGFERPPTAFFFVRGVGVPQFNADGSEGTPGFSTNAIRCLADYLTSEDYGPPGIALSDLDGASWYAAQQIADAPRALQTRVRQASYDADPSPKLEALAFPAPDARQYECGGAISTGEAFGAAIGKFLDVMPHARLWLALDGKIKIALPDPSTTPGSRVVMEIGPDDLLAVPTIIEPDETIRTNEVLVQHSGYEDDYAEVSVAAEDATAFARDGRLLSRSASVDLAYNLFQGAQIATEIMNASRRTRYEWPMTRRGIVLEPGDVVRIEEPISRLNKYVEVVDLTFDRWLRPTIYAYDLPAATFSRLTTRPGRYSWTVPDDVTSITVTIDGGGGGGAGAGGEQRFGFQRQGGSAGAGGDGTTNGSPGGAGGSGVQAHQSGTPGAAPPSEDGDDGGGGGGAGGDGARTNSRSSSRRTLLTGGGGGGGGGQNGGDGGDAIQSGIYFPRGYNTSSLSSAFGPGGGGGGGQGGSSSVTVDGTVHEAGGGSGGGGGSGRTDVSTVDPQATDGAGGTGTGGGSPGGSGAASDYGGGGGGAPGQRIVQTLAVQAGDVVEIEIGAGGGGGGGAIGTDGMNGAASGEAGSDGRVLLEYTTFPPDPPDPDAMEPTPFDSGAGTAADPYVASAAEFTDAADIKPRVRSQTETVHTLTDIVAAIAFTPQMTGPHTFRLGFVHAEQDLDIYLFDGNTLVASAVSTDDDEAMTADLAAGVQCTMLVRAYPSGWNAGMPGGLTRLTLQIDTP